MVEAIEKLEMPEESLLDRIYENQFPSCYREKRLWKIPLSDIMDYQKKVRMEESVPISEAVKLLSLEDKLYEIIEKNYFPNAYKVFDEWNIPISDIEEFRLRSLALIEYVDLDKAAVILKVSPNQVFTRIKYREFTRVFKFKGKWWISKTDIANYEVTGNVSTANTFTAKEAIKRLGSNDSAMSLMLKEGKFPNAFKVWRSWHIPVKDVENFEKKQAEEKKKIEITPEAAYPELKDFLDTIVISENLQVTKSLYLQYCLLQINNMSGSNSYKRSRVLLYKRLYNNLMNTLTKEIFLISSDEISEMLSERSTLTKDQRKVLILFLNYAYNKKSIEPEHQFSLTTTKDSAEEKEIYSPELFHEIYQYVKDNKSHIPLALKDQRYANMWAYTILLLTDYIRGQDLILNTPSIDLEAIKINSLDWFFENKLSEFQEQFVINQLYTRFRFRRTSKTDELLTFIVSPDLVGVLAHALVISELHRRHSGSELMLETFLVGKFNAIRTQGKAGHRLFFKGMKSSRNFKFSSLKMNNSVATYLFYSITEEDGQDSDLALHLTQVARSHKSPDTTSQYIQATNKDGSINRVSYNLFKRGHFGWLYNYLILYVSQFQGMQDTLEQRSNLIEQVRQEISPLGLESVAKFVNTSLAPIPLKNPTDSMETLLGSIYKKRQSVISKLTEYSKEEIRVIITKLANGDLPSKNEHAQCLVFPNCKNPGLSNCFSCEYVIPGNLMLIQLNEELSRLITNIQAETNDLILRRESRFLMHALFIWKEARIEFGDERVRACIDTEKTWKMIEDVAHKILTD